MAIDSETQLIRFLSSDFWHKNKKLDAKVGHQVNFVRYTYSSDQQSNSVSYQKMV